MKPLILLLAIGCFVTLNVCAGPQQTVPTNSLAFHLRSLGRTPTQQEREVIETALKLMQRHGCRSDYPLRSIKRDDTKKEWILCFDSGQTDAGFDLFLADKNASYVEVHWPGTDWRTRYPSKRSRKN